MRYFKLSETITPLLIFFNDSYALTIFFVLVILLNILERIGLITSYVILITFFFVRIETNKS